LTRQTRLPDVTEGYTTPPFSKSYSTGDIFNSANDTLRNIFPPQAASSKTAETVLVSPKKRARPYPEDYDGDYEIEEDYEDAEMAPDGQSVGTSLPLDKPTLGRLMKPLPSRRTPRKGMLTTRSLPGSSMRQLEDKSISDVTMKEEEDWSVLAAQTHTTSFEPMMLS
jgi:hypothetical protein